MFIISELKKIPKDQIVVIQIKKGDDVYCISSDATKKRYFLYKELGGCYEKISTGSSPIELENKYIWR